MEQSPGDLGAYLLRMAKWICFALAICAFYLLIRSQGHPPLKHPASAASTTNEAVRQAYAARSKAIHEAMKYRYVPSPGDADGDFWTDAAELAAHTDPNNPERHPPYSFTIDGDQGAVTTGELRLHFPSGLTADY